MNPSRRAVLLAGVLAVSGCTGSPLVVAPDGVQRIAPEEPVQDPAFVRAAEAVAGVKAAVEGLPESEWRTAALAQCEDQLARFASADPFAAPDPVFQIPEVQDRDLTASIDEAVPSLVELATDSEGDDHSLLLTSVAAATLALRNGEIVPGEGTEPTRLEPLAGQRQAALTHAWALIAAIEQGMDVVDREDPLRDKLKQRLSSAKELRAELRAGASEVPSQPPYFDLPALGSAAEVSRAWPQLESNLVEALVLLSAHERAHHDLWQQQIEAAQAAGAQLPRWPGWD